ncbi:MAG: MMPL family transporter [Deltaproteobacteria bacterium]|nr:MMPL family transporter [Deltaproteobacteria bacterium]
MNNVFRSWVQILLKTYWIIVLLVLIAAYFSFPKMVFLLKHISTDPVDLLPKEYPSVQTLLQIRDKIENKPGVPIVLESENPENTLKFLEDLKTLFLKNPLVGEVVDRKVGYEFFDKNKMLYMDLEDLRTLKERIDRKIQRTKLGAFYVDLEDEDTNQDLKYEDIEAKYRNKYSDGAQSQYYQSANKKVFAFFVVAKAAEMGLSEQAEFQEEARKILNTLDPKKYDSTLKVYFAGATKVVEYRSLIKDLKTAGLVSAILIFLPLLLRFRRPDYVLLIFLPMAIGVPISFAISSLWVHQLNVTTSFLFAILGGLGIETGIHVFSRYFHKRSEGLSQGEALLDLYEFQGPAILTSVASLAVTFLLLLMSDFKGFSEFGLISGIGLWTIFFLYFTFFPALLILVEKFKLLRFHLIQEGKARPFTPSRSFVTSLLIIFSLFTLFSLFIIPKVRFEYNSKKIRADFPEVRLAKSKQREAEGKRVNNPAVVIVENREEADALAHEVEKRKSENPHSVIDTARSYYSLIPKDQDEKLKLIAEIHALLSDDTIKLVKDEKKKDLDRFKQALLETQKVSESDIPSDLKNIFKGKDQPPGVLFFINALPQLEMDNGKNSMAFSKDVAGLQTKNKIYYPSNDAIVFGDVLRTMFRDSKWVMLASVLCIFFFVYLNFRNLKKSSLVMFSILSGVVWVMGVLFLSGMSLNLYNMVMIPSIMGMSIDNSIHVYHSYEEMGQGSLGRVLREAGLSSLLASLTNAAGFLGLLFCHHGGLRSMGVVASIGLATCLISTLVFLPMILQFFEWRKKNIA